MSKCTLYLLHRQIASLRLHNLTRAFTVQKFKLRKCQRIRDLAILFGLDLGFMAHQDHFTHIEPSQSSRWGKRIKELSHDKTNKMACAPSEDRSAWASAQSDQSSLYTWRNLGSLATLERTANILIRLGGCPGSNISKGIHITHLQAERGFLTSSPSGVWTCMDTM